MNFEKFIRDERSRYELFVKTVTAILQAAIAAQPRDFRLQQGPSISRQETRQDKMRIG